MLIREEPVDPLELLNLTFERGHGRNRARNAKFAPSGRRSASVVSRGSNSASGFGGTRHLLRKIAYAAQASLFACEEGVVVHEAIGAFSEGRILMDLTFRRGGVRPSRSSGRPARDRRGGARRSRERAGWGIDEGHLKRLIILHRS